MLRKFTATLFVSVFLNRTGPMLIPSLELDIWRVDFIQISGEYLDIFCPDIGFSTLLIVCTVRLICKSVYVLSVQRNKSYTFLINAEKMILIRVWFFNYKKIK